ncbi:microsomal dipeptidase-like Zn-dependent dipeptidase [Ewingella americana]
MNNTERGTQTLIPVFDGHNDVLLQLWEQHRQNPEQAFLQGPASGQMDLPRCQQAGFAGGLFAAWVPSPRFDAASVPDPQIDAAFFAGRYSKTS